jgi:hypothetical protein
MNPTDPLSELRDIHLPETIGWQLAPGWPILAILLLAALAFTLIRLVRRHRQRAFRREALVLFDALKADSEQSPPERVQAIASLLKRVAISRYGRDETAGLTGEAWLAFLDKTGNTTAFTEGAGRALGDALYRPDSEADVDALINLSLAWIRRQ